MSVCGLANVSDAVPLVGGGVWPSRTSLDVDLTSHNGKKASGTHCISHICCMLRMMNHHRVCTVSILYACSLLSYFLSQEYPWNSLFRTHESKSVSLFKCIQVFYLADNPAAHCKPSVQVMPTFRILTFSLWVNHSLRGCLLWVW